MYGCGRNAEKSDDRVKNDNRIARSWVHSKNPQIARDLEDLKHPPEPFSAVLHLRDAGKLTDSELAGYLGSLVKTASTRDIHFRESPLDQIDCSAVYDRVVGNSKVQMGEMRSTVFNLNRVGLDELQLLRVFVRVRVPWSTNSVILESSSLLISLNVNGKDLINEKGHLMKNVLLSPGEPDEVERRYSVFGFTTLSLGWMAGNLLVSFKKRMRIIARKVTGCLIIPEDQSENPTNVKFKGIESEPVIHQ